MRIKGLIAAFICIVCLFIINTVNVFALPDADTLNNEIYPSAAYAKGIVPPFTLKDAGERKINPATGNMVIKNTDLYLEGRNGLDFSLTRYYNIFETNIYAIWAYNSGLDVLEDVNVLTYADRHFDLGAGWAFDIPYLDVSSGWPRCLHYGVAGSWLLEPEGTYDMTNDRYTFVDYNVYDFVLRVDWIQGEFQYGGRYSSYILEEKDGKRLYFDYNGFLIGIKDRFGNEIKFQYADRYFYYNLNLPVLSKVVDSVGREINFTYDDTNHRIVVAVTPTDGTNARTIIYNKARIVDILGNNMDNTIVPDEYVLTSVVDSENRTTSYQYNYNHTKTSFKFKPVTDTPNDGIGIDSVNVCLLREDYPSGGFSVHISYKYTKNCGDDGSMHFYKTFNSNDYYEGGTFQEVYLYKRDGTYEFDGYPYSSPGLVRTDNIETNPDTSSNTAKLSYNSDLLCTYIYKEGPDHKSEINYEYDWRKQPTKTIEKTYNKSTGQFVEKKENFEYNEYRDLTGYWDEQADRDANNMPLNNEHKTTYTYQSSYHYLTGKTYKRDATATIQEEYVPTSNGKSAEWVRVYDNTILKKQSRYIYDTYGNVTEERNYLDNWLDYLTTKYSYDDNVTQRSGKFNGLYVTRKYVEGVRDIDNNLVEARAGISAGTIDEIYKYNWFGNMTNKQDGTGNITTYLYDKLNRVTRETNPDMTYKTWSYYTGSSDNSVVFSDENGNQIKYGYNKIGLLIYEKDMTTGQYLNQYEYDRLLRLYRENNHNTSDNSRQITYTYFSNGRLKQKTVYDKFSNLLLWEQYAYDDAYNDAGINYLKTSKTVWNSPAIVTNTYIDKSGRIVKQGRIHSGTEYIDTFKYDYLGNKTEEKSSRAYNEGWEQAYTAKYEYNFANKVVKTYNITGDYATTEYDALGRVKTVTDIKENMANPVYSTTYVYDALGRVIKESIPFENVSGTIYYTAKKQYYDRDSNVILSMTSRNEPGETDTYSQTDYEYNSRNMLTKVTTYDGGTSENYTQYYYDAVGNKLRMYTGLSSPLTINGLDIVTTGSDNEYSVAKYQYNRFGKLTRMTDPLNQEENYTYDLNGNLTGKTDRNGSTFTMTYDGYGRLLTNSVATLDGTGDASYTYTYNFMGEIKTMNGGGVNTTYTYDDLGRLVNEAESNGIAKEYTYDADNNRKTLVVKKDGVIKENTAYTYDNMNRLYQVSENGQLNVTYTYDENGNRESLVYNNGNTCNYNYNLANKLKLMTNKNGVVNLSQYSYTYSLDGNQVSKTETVTGTITDYLYDGLSRLLSETESGSPTVFYTYDDYNNRETMSVSGTSQTSYEYDDNSRLTTEIKITGDITNTIRYFYDNNGNQIYKAIETEKPSDPEEEETISAWISGEDGEGIETLSEYNGFNQLVRVTSGGMSAAYTYNGTGLRTGKTINDVTTSHVWDGQNIVLELDGNGAVMNKYIRGINIIFAVDGVDTNQKYYLYNGHGDVVQLTGTDGSVSKTYAYDAFGNEKNPDTSDTNVFRYCGEYFDKETGSYYLRARYYDPTIGRFISEDSCSGKDNDLLSLNLYTYVYNNPILYIDPSGHIGIKSDGTIYMGAGDTFVDMQLLQLKMQYDKEGSNKQGIADKAKKLREANPGMWHVSAKKSLDYYTIIDITDTLNNLMASLDEVYAKERIKSPDKVLIDFYNLTRNHAQYDLKNRPESVWQHEHFYYNEEIVDKDVPGNINYAYLGKVMGIGDTVLIKGAGVAQQLAGTTNSKWINMEGFGDDPRDTARIKQGIQIYKDNHKKFLWWWY